MADTTMGVWQLAKTGEARPMEPLAEMVLAETREPWVPSHLFVVSLAPYDSLG